MRGVVLVGLSYILMSRHDKAFLWQPLKINPMTGSGRNSSTQFLFKQVDFNLRLFLRQEALYEEWLVKNKDFFHF